MFVSQKGVLVKWWQVADAGMDDEEREDPVMQSATTSHVSKNVHLWKDIGQQLRVSLAS